METVLLTKEEFLATMSSPVQDVSTEATDVVHIWQYVAAIPKIDLRGHSINDRFVEHVYRDSNSYFDHVLVMTTTKNVYLVVVVDLKNDRVHGHRLLDLNEEYGLPPK
jgi:hypothetical protein